MENNDKGYQLIISYIEKAKNESLFTGEDLVGIFNPILTQLEKIHSGGHTGLQSGLSAFAVNNNGRLRIDESKIKPVKNNLTKINNILPEKNQSFDIVAQQSLTIDVSAQTTSWEDHLESDDNEIIAPVYVRGYSSFESVLNHHDPITDIQVLGLIMASCAFGIDLREKEGVKSLVQIIQHPGHAGRTLHPNLVRLIMDMVQLDRRKRIRDATSARIRLENYQEYSQSSNEDIDEVIDQYQSTEGDRNQWILKKLRNRLFDLSKRNRLIYFKKTSRYVNLTLSSVPHVLDYKNIRPEKLFIWNEKISKFLSTGGKIKLNNFLQIHTNPQIGISLKKVYYEGNKDIAEYGFNQLKLAFCFLNWYNYRENSNEKIQSPLLLLVASLKKKKGINDEFTLTIDDPVAQVNPVLSFYLKELYDIRLPSFFDLSKVDIDSIYQKIRQAIVAKSNEVNLEMVKKPRLRLIYSLAKRSYENYQKKVRRNISREIWGGDGNYSYDSADYRPLGVQLFRKKVEKEASVLEFLIDDKIKLKHNAVESTSKRELFQIESDGSINPYLWEFDLTNFTLGNFNYQKMTLVNDYDSLLETKDTNPIFETLFSKEPKKSFPEKDQLITLKNNYDVIPADPTQQSSITHSYNNESYIIQGPPGTGKSQTIVNLLAHQVSQGKSILFISEKRAALDVVYARMTQVGLEDICTLIHDSQSDKKDFIFNLKEVYEKYEKEESDLDKITQKREHLIHQLNERISILEEFHNFHAADKDNLRIREVMDTLLHFNFKKDHIDSKHFSGAPEYTSWITLYPKLEKIKQGVVHNSTFKSIQQCPYFFMNGDQILKNGSNFIANACQELESNLNRLQNIVSQTIEIQSSSLSQLLDSVDFFTLAVNLEKTGKLELIDSQSSLSKELVDKQELIKNLRQEIIVVAEKNQHWTKKPDRDELLRLVKSYEEIKDGFFNKILGKKDQFINNLRPYYNFDAHMVPPTPEELFSNLENEQNLGFQISKLQEEIKIEGIDSANLSGVRKQWEKIKNDNDNLSLALLLEKLKAQNIPQDLVLNTKTSLKELNIQEDNVYHIYEQLDNLRISAASIFSLTPLLREWYLFPSDVRKYIEVSKLTLDQISYVSAYNYLLQMQGLTGANVSGVEVKGIVDEIKNIYPEFLEVNSTYIREKVKHNFHSALDLSYIPTYELSKEQAKKKKDYKAGRAILENEFNKKVRYKSIRELSSEETNVVIRDLKPIWMMSPLSVSDTLPLQEIFDVVIFDEASQITVEEGVPPLFRAKKAIIVGDEMQMPPSNFFSTKIEDDDENNEEEFLFMDADSLLNQGLRKLPQVTLGWHYRSRKEALINFSNYAFYQGKLMTIPDVGNPKIEQNEIEIYESEDAIKMRDVLLANSITYHYLSNGVYVNRMNDAEAEYIAHMVRELLLSENQLSIGIVAFSIQQQGNIEDALSSLANSDPKFALALDNAYAGNEEEEFTGLFVKNLENVQGDERDIMILSICYGYNSKGKMLMNFGPINRRGGEKRLNVIFSRAKMHMAVVASIKHSDITNEYNEGANYLKKFLQYSELISNGNTEHALEIIQQLGRKNSNHEYSHGDIGFTNQIKEWLESESLIVKENLGQSRLKIDLGVKKNINDEQFVAGILIDHTSGYKDENIINKYYSVPNILEQFGWRIYKLYAKDWLHNQSLVKKDLLQFIKQENNPSLNELHPVMEDPIPSEGLIQRKVSLINPSTNKFWEIMVSNLKVTITMGELGEEGFSNVTHFETDDKANNFYEDQIAMRKRRGFLEK